MITDYFSLKGKRALITGAGKGIGARIATAFAEMGADVALVARTQSDLDSVANEVRALGREAHTFACDVTDEVALTSAVQTLTEAWGSLDILINNAGAPGQGYGSLKKVTKARFENTIDINLTSAYTLTHLALPLLKASQQGSIVNVSSALGWMVDRNFAAYGAAKAGMDQMTRILAYELAPSIRVNGIAPGAIETPSTAFITQNEDMYNATVRWIPQGRLGKPDDIALAALYLASNASGFVSGKIIEVDGGMAALPGTAIEANFARSMARE
ncbi:MAG: SDR family NAD(P)-dependent oxidoreductase [Gammaproteobacteria bacterium]